MLNQDAMCSSRGDSFCLFFPPPALIIWQHPYQVSASNDQQVQSASKQKMPKLRANKFLEKGNCLGDYTGIMYQKYS